MPNYLTDISGVTEGTGGNAAANGAAIQAAINAASGGTWYLRPGEHIRSSQLVLPSNTAIIYDGPKTTRPRFYMPAATFTNTTLVSPSDYTTGCLLKIQGQTSGSYTPVNNVHLEGFIIQSEVQDGRALNAISARNVTNLKAHGIEIYGLPIGSAFNLDSVINFEIDNLFVHDCTTNLNTWTPGSYMNVTGLSVDNGRINSIGSSNGTIRYPHFRDITVGATFLGTYGSGRGHQTDGICLNYGCSRIRIISPKAYNVAEPLDIQGEYITVSDIDFENCPAYGLKFVHGARYCSVTGGRIKNAGIAHITFAGSNSSGVGDTMGNTVTGLVLLEIGSDGYYNGITQASIKLEANGTTYKPKFNLVSDVIIDATGADAVIVDDTSATDNSLLNYTLIAGASVFDNGFNNKSNVCRPAKMPRASIARTTAQSIPAGSAAALLFDSTIYDTHSSYSSANGRFTALQSGYYELTASTRFDAVNPNKTFRIVTRRNGVSEVNTTMQNFSETNDLMMSVTTQAYLTVGEYLQVYAYNGDSVARNVTGNSEVTHASFKML
jgi:hypothetical protein